MAQPNTAAKFSISIGGHSSSKKAISSRLSSVSGSGTPKFGQSGSGHSTPLKRSAAVLLSDVDADVDDASTASEQAAILTFGQQSPRSKQQAESIQPIIRDHDWLGESKRRWRQRKEHEAAQEQTKRNKEAEEIEKTQKAEISYGLTLNKPVASAREIVDDDAAEREQRHEQKVNGESAQGQDPVKTAADMQDDSAEMGPEEETADEEAIAALMGKKPRAATETVMIQPATPPTEEAAFYEAYHAAPDSATLNEYAATSIEGFGAAVLRGYMKPGQTLDSLRARARKGKDRNAGGGGGTQVPGDTKRRPGLLGLGAKDSGIGVELGAWGKSDMRKKEGQEIYTPVPLRHKNTGEIITEEQMKQRLNKQALEDAESRRDSSRKHHRRRDDYDEDDVGRSGGKRAKAIDWKEDRDSRRDRRFNEYERDGRSERDVGDGRDGTRGKDRDYKRQHSGTRSRSNSRERTRKRPHRHDEGDRDNMSIDSERRDRGHHRRDGRNREREGKRERERERKRHSNKRRRRDRSSSSSSSGSSSDSNSDHSSASPFSRESSPSSYSSSDDNRVRRSDRGRRRYGNERYHRRSDQDSHRDGRRREGHDRERGRNHRQHEDSDTRSSSSSSSRRSSTSDKFQRRQRNRDDVKRRRRSRVESRRDLCESERERTDARPSQRDLGRDKDSHRLHTDVVDRNDRGSGGGRQNRDHKESRHSRRL